MTTPMDGSGRGHRAGIPVRELVSPSATLHGASRRGSPCGHRRLLMGHRRAESGRVAHWDPADLPGGPSAVLPGTSVTTNAVYVQDFVLWLPLMAVATVWL